jgi:hypothetical protein
MAQSCQRDAHSVCCSSAAAATRFLYRKIGDIYLMAARLRAGVALRPITHTS